MVDIVKKKFFSENIIQLQINFLFISFIFLSSLKYDFFQFIFLILILLLPCGLNIIKDCVNKRFKNITIFFFFSFILSVHSLLNIHFENANITKYNLLGIFLLVCLFIISFISEAIFGLISPAISSLFILLELPSLLCTTSL